MNGEASTKLAQAQQTVNPKSDQLALGAIND